MVSGLLGDRINPGESRSSRSRYPPLILWDRSLPCPLPFPLSPIDLSGLEPLLGFGAKDDEKDDNPPIMELKAGKDLALRTIPRGLGGIGDMAMGLSRLLVGLGLLRAGGGS